MTSALRSPAGAAAVDDFLHALGTGLRGPRRFRSDLLLEVRTGIEDAAGALTEAGWAPEEAVRMAVADFGSPAELAAEFQPTVASRMVGRAALLGSIVLPLVMAGWAAVYGRPPQVHVPAAAHPCRAW